MHALNLITKHTIYIMRSLTLPDLNINIELYVSIVYTEY